MALRLGYCCSYSPAGDLAKIKEEDPELAKECTEGQRWIILPESLDPSLKADICAWRNQDQNENQAITDGELVRLAKLSVDDFLVGSGGQVQLPMSQLVASTCNRTPPAHQPQRRRWVLPLCVHHGG